MTPQKGDPTQRNLPRLPAHHPPGLLLLPCPRLCLCCCGSSVVCGLAVSVILGFAVVSVVVLVLRSFVALVFGLVCGLRVCGVLLFAPWFYADCVVRGFG